jgi:hypothetical protein
MARLYLERRPGETREGLAKKIGARLADEGIEYHVKTIRRQLLGHVESVPPEVEAELETIVHGELGLDADRIRDVLAERGELATGEDRASPYVAIERTRVLIDLWLHFNPGRSKRFLGKKLQRDLAAAKTPLSFDSIVGKLTGRGKVVRRDVHDLLLRYLSEHGVHSEEEARARSTTTDAVDRSKRGRRLVPADRFRSLCRLWQLNQRQASSRRLAALLRKKLAERGIDIGIDQLQRAIAGKTKRVRQDVTWLLEELVNETLPEGGVIDEQLASPKLTGLRNQDLAWVKCAPIAEMAREWLDKNPDTSMRQLSQAVATTVKRMGYSTSHNSIQPILGGWKKKTRGFVYRAMAKQLTGERSPRIPDEHLLSVLPKPPPRPRRTPARAKKKATTFTAYIREVRKYLPNAQSPYFVQLAALRAEKMYGVSAEEAARKILRKAG